MVVQALNNRAKDRYTSFLTSISVVEGQFAELDRAISRVKSKGHKWQVATQQELRAMRRTAFDHLQELRVTAKKYESELLSREWRV
jgi:hypothetical protein